MNIYIIFSYFLSFIFYSFLGWGMEVLLTLCRNKKFVDRGFLLGPYCPIYGFGCLLIIFFLKRYTDNVLVLFILAMVICLSLEYLTSLIMELIFKARWWDYSNKKYNINGRICLEYGLFFGIAGSLIMYVVHPFILGLIGRLSDSLLLIIGITVLVLFLIDFIVSFVAVSNINKFEFKKYNDSTEDISLMVREYLLKHSKLTKRLVKAFPSANMKIKNLKAGNKN